MMDLVELMRSRVDLILETVGSGMKVMLMDAETTSSLSLCTPQSEIMKREVFLFEYLHSRIDHYKSEKVSLCFLKCVVLMRPTKDNVRLLSLELSRPRFGSYFVYFTNKIPKGELKALAESDVHEVVQDVKEIACDFMALEPHAFSFGETLPALASGHSFRPESLQKSLDSLRSLLVALKVGTASEIAYVKKSPVCEELAMALRQQLASHSDFSAANNATVVIIDRRTDPVTPFLNQWTYQAMIHEVVGVKNNTVDLSGRDGGDVDTKQLLTLSSTNDDFFRENMYANFGEIGQTIQKLVQSFQETVKGHQKIDSIGDIKEFVANYPEFKKMSGTVNKHVSILSELSKDVKRFSLMEASEVEQTIVCGSDKENSLPKIQAALESPQLRPKDALRIVALYTIRYGQVVERNLDAVCRSVRGMAKKEVYEFIQLVAKYGRGVRSEYLFEDSYSKSNNPFGMLSSLRGAENVYTQHRPFVTKEILPDVVKGKSRTDLSYLSRGPPTSACGDPFDGGRPRKVVLFFVGGFTYEECQAVYRENTRLKGCNAVIGGTSLLNFDSYLEEIRAACKNHP